MFDKIDKNFGFGVMRLPMVDGQVDTDQFTEMVDIFMEAGFRYFDTAHVYLEGQSEVALAKCLTSRYSRESYVLTNKLSGSCFETESDIRPLFEEQLKACGVEYFDFYLMHAQSSENYEKYKSCRAYETALELKEEGKIRHLGISFHDTAQFLEQILKDYPQIEVVQLQLNYLDMDSPSVQSRACYDVCCRYGKPVIVMEPVKGGKLAQLPPEAHQVFAELSGGSDASYAIRYAAGFSGIIMVLSGMSDAAMVRDNCAYMQDYKPLNSREQAAVEKVLSILRKQEQIACTNCRYCMEVCPVGVPIPELFSCLNMKKQLQTWDADVYARRIGGKGAKASSCIKCGACEKVCPQHLPIRKHLGEAEAEFEGK